MSNPSDPGSSQEEASAAPASGDRLSAWLLTSFHSAMDGMVVTDSARRIVLLNRETERMFGYPAKRLVGKPLDVLFSILSHTDHWPRFDALLQTMPGAPEAQLRLELQGVRADGNEFRISAGVSALTSDGERFLALVLRAMADDDTPPPSMTPELLRRLNASTQHANEVERRRFSRELYDDLGQNLGALKIDLDWLQGDFADAGPQFRQRIERMQTTLDSIIVRTKSIASDLRPPLLDDFGLAPALKWACERFEKKTGIRCTLQSGELGAKIGDPVESVIFRVVQEGLLNIERHAQADHASLALWRTGDSLHVLLRDNGVGIEDGHRHKPGCFGLLVMQQRIYALGGKISIANMQPAGVEIHASIPLDTETEAEVAP
ncbi:MAG: histidine kinase [Burkholderiaceae bacterium]